MLVTFCYHIISM